MKTVVAGALGECVHVAGVYNFLRLAEQLGWNTVFLGPAVPAEKILQTARDEKADLIAVSYRLTPETGERLLAEFAEAADDLRTQGIQFAFGGTVPVAEKAKKLGFFDAIFDGTQTREEIITFLRGDAISESGAPIYPQTAIERILWKRPFPLLRHHFGQPCIKATVEGIEQIANAKVLDVISLGIDQDAQENFFHPGKQDPRCTGAGGVPVRSPDDYIRLYQASRKGNYPLMRTYSGTNDLIRLAEMYCETIHICWAAVPLFWYNQMDGRGPFDLENSIREHQNLIHWYSDHDIPVELNEPHHWGMRDAPDVLFVVAAYLAAYNARAFGTHDYIAQMMFNSPSGTSDAMDLAKMLACLEISLPLESKLFHIWKQTRTGLLSYPLEENAARAHLAASIYVQMALKPDIVHIVGHTEAHHAANAQDVIEASLMAQRVIENALHGQPDMLDNPLIQQRKEHLIHEAQITLQAIRNLNTKSERDPFTDPETLALAIRTGILDAPQLRNNKFARGIMKTAIIEGACEVVDESGNPLPEEKRLAHFL
ncbi:MAG: cobalamin B12-binding domain-containing protein [Anaerolineaceae bacterium]|jgi:methylmalonyl-CoA mutase cobalamin-binding subunit|nr:MAG: cobalamin B12-binding domain-containing protein [Anaerolineaceae bacterium]